MPLKRKEKRQNGQRKIHVHAPGSLDYNQHEFVSPERLISTATKPIMSDASLTGTYMTVAKQALINPVSEIADFDVSFNRVRQPFYSKY